MVNEEYINHLWFVMHHADDPKGLAMSVTCYLDESGTHKGSLQAVVGGLVLNKEGFQMLDITWESILSSFDISVPIHMNEFGKNRKLGHINYQTRYELFNQLVGAINCLKIHSVAYVIDQDKFNEIIDERIKKSMSPYGACFMGCAHLTLKSAINSNYFKDVSFLLDHGCEHNGHILTAHKEMINLQSSGEYFIHVGSLSFEPKKLSALQAADIIAWGVYRKSIGAGIGKGFQPINKIFDYDHVQAQYDNQWLININNAILSHK